MVLLNNHTHTHKYLINNRIANEYLKTGETFDTKLLQTHTHTLTKFDSIYFATTSLYVCVQQTHYLFIDCTMNLKLIKDLAQPFASSATQRSYVRHVIYLSTFYLRGKVLK